MQTALEIARQLEYVTEEEFQGLDTIATETAKTLWGLLRKMSVTATRTPVS